MAEDGSGCSTGAAGTSRATCQVRRTFQPMIPTPGHGAWPSGHSTEAFLAATLEWGEKGGPGWKHYFALVAQANANPVWGGETMTRYFDPVIHRLIDLLKKAMPGARTFFIIGITSYHKV